MIQWTRTCAFVATLVCACSGEVPIQSGAAREDAETPRAVVVEDVDTASSPTDAAYGREPPAVLEAGAPYRGSARDPKDAAAAQVSSIVPARRTTAPLDAAARRAQLPRLEVAPAVPPSRPTSVVTIAAAAPVERQAFSLPVAVNGLPARLELASNWRLEVVFPGLTFDDPVAMVPVPTTQLIVIAEREGRLYVFDNDAEVREKRIVLDLYDRTQGENDSGLLGVAFHPEFGLAESERRGLLYIHYAFKADPIQGSVPPEPTPTRSRLSRFEVDLETMVADPQSESVLIDQADDSVWHQGGAMFFHPKDGFLYLTVGDEGNMSCQLGNCQRIDEDLFGGVLRLDVDQLGGAISHPIPRQPQTGVTMGYNIPSNNPFVGEPNALEEFYAIGLRSPHRMTHDPVDDLTWIGDVGQEGREEINLLARGANYQWDFFEGTQLVRDVSPVPLGVWTDPLLELDRRQARSVIGGYVYRGERLPELSGRYIFADFSSGGIWALPYTVEGEQVTRGEPDLLLTADLRDRENGITSLGVDSAGELYFLSLGSEAQIRRLARASTETNLPRNLSDVLELSRLSEPLADGALSPYSVNVPLWSDGAVKTRWLALPEGGRIGFSPTGAWDFPPGTVFVKHFEIALDEQAPEVLVPLETRLLVIGEDGAPYGITYKWNDERTDATFVLAGETQRLNVTRADGSLDSQDYAYPGAADCLTCHNPEAGHVLGVRTSQLNGPRDSSGNQLLEWETLGMFEPLAARRPDRDQLDDTARLVALEDTSAPVETRVRSYWDANCSFCHGSRSVIRSQWDARFSTPLEAQGVIGAEPVNGPLGDAEWLIAPGDPQRSLLYLRDASSSPGLRMPPLGSRRQDEAYLTLLREWIEGLVEIQH
jgi:uncharacterized repeat protein (TIGR03806 family)